MLFTRSFLALVFSTQVSLFVKGATWSPDGSTFPNPIFDQVSCNRHPNISSSVCDPDNILKLHDSDRVQAAINEIFDIEDDCGHGYEVGVVVVEKLDLSGTSDDAAIRKFARSVHDNWGVGNAECNSGILFALSTLDRVFFFSTGDGTKQIITTSRVDSMTKMNDFLGKDRFGDGTVQAMLNIQSLILEGPETQSFVDKYWWIFLVAFLGVPLTCGVCIACVNEYRTQQLLILRSEFIQHKHRILCEFRKQNTPNTVCPLCLETFDTAPVRHGCGHYYHDTCMEGQSTCPICTKIKLLGSLEEDQETRVKFGYLSKKYPTIMPFNDAYYYSSYSFLRSNESDPPGCDPICRDNYVAPSNSGGGGYSHTSSGFSGGGFGGGCSSGGAGGHF